MLEGLFALSGVGPASEDSNDDHARGPCWCSYASLSVSLGLPGGHAGVPGPFCASLLGWLEAMVHIEFIAPLGAGAPGTMLNEERAKVPGSPTNRF